MKQFFTQCAGILDKEITKQGLTKFAFQGKIQQIAVSLWPDYSDSERDCIIETLKMGSADNVGTPTTITAAFMSDMEACRNKLQIDQTNRELSDRFKDGLKYIGGSAMDNKPGLNHYKIEFDDGFMVEFEPIVREDGTPGLLVKGSTGPSFWS
ncbi:hypothetical protein [Enterobacter quasiroggenkampii]|uniref:hypothetical protein n=1 Tax=Enterobacter quasiroggenkampii TaxID=2497436 RepID=UPI0021D2AD49|nr:hypothetical protein [Enterobacter quasiroggenkampii]MCU6406626.1 hypothetical protein [Enterobacter quasiroggenkampii]